MKTIIINKSNLVVNDYDSLETITIESENGSGLYYGTNQDGDEVRLTRNELKKIGNINLIDETLEHIRNMESDRVYTDDMMNFIDKNDYENLSEEFKEVKEDYEQVKFVIE